MKDLEARFRKRNEAAAEAYADHFYGKKSEQFSKQSLDLRNGAAQDHLAGANSRLKSEMQLVEALEKSKSELEVLIQSHSFISGRTLVERAAFILGHALAEFEKGLPDAE